MRKKGKWSLGICIRNWIVDAKFCIRKLLTGVTLIKATENETRMTKNVNISLAYRRSLKNPLNSSIKPVITHSRPPIYEKNANYVILNTRGKNPGAWLWRSAHNPLLCLFLTLGQVFATPLAIFRVVLRTNLLQNPVPALWAWKRTKQTKYGTPVAWQPLLGTLERPNRAPPWPRCLYEPPACATWTPNTWRWQTRRKNW